MRRSRYLFMVLVLTLISVVFVGCNSDDKVYGENDPIELKMWCGGQWTGTDLANLKTFIHAFNEDNDLNITVKIEVKTDLQQQFSTSLTSGRQPDLMVWDRFNTPSYSRQDFLVELDEQVKDLDLTKYHSEAIKEMQFDGHTYGLPIDLDVWGVYVNMDMVEEAGIDEEVYLTNEWTWDDLKYVAEQLTKKGSVAGLHTLDLQQHYFKYMTSTGVPFFNDTTPVTPNFDNQQSRDTLEFFESLYNADLCWGGFTEKVCFPTSKLAMIHQSTYFADYVKKQNATMNFKFLPQPKYSKGESTLPEGSNAVNGGMIGGFGLAIPKPASKHRTKAWESRVNRTWQFMKYWAYEDENAMEWSKTSRTLPSIQSLHTNEFIKNDPVLSNVTEFVGNYKIRPQMPGYSLVQLNSINPSVSSYLESGTALEDTIANMIKEANRIIELNS